MKTLRPRYPLAGALIPGGRGKIQEKGLKKKKSAAVWSMASTQVP